MESNSERRKKIASQLLEELLKTSYNETLALCEELGYKLEDLQPASKEQFKEKGVTADLISLRFNHHEERRVAKIFKIAEEISKNIDPSQSIQSLVKLSANPIRSRLPSAKSARSESFSFTKPRDYITYGLEKEKEKFNRSVKTMERIALLREVAKTQADMKRQKFEEQTKVIQNNLNKKKEDFSKTVNNNVEHRKRILAKKYENCKKVDLEMANYGKELDKRMSKLSDWQKIEIKKKLKQKLEKFKQRMSDKQARQDLEYKLDKEYDFQAEKLLFEIREKIDKRVNEYLGLVGSRVQSARDHSLKVNNILNSSFRIDSALKNESLRKNINKSLMTSKKLRQKSLIASESSEKMKKTMYESFQKNKRGRSEVFNEENRRLEVINNRFQKKEQIFNNIRKTISTKYEEKKQKNFNRTERHFQNYIERQREEILKRQRVMDKHKHVSAVAEELSNYKAEVSYNKRASNLQVQRIRSSRVSPSVRHSILTPRRFDLTY